MGSLNTFYLMGRVARAASPMRSTRSGAPVVSFAVSPGTHGRPPRGGPAFDAIDVEAAGPQAEQALRLRVGQGVFVRGALRAEQHDGHSVLMAYAQSIESVMDVRRPPRPPREDGAPRPEGEEGAEGAPTDGAPGEGEAAGVAPVGGAPIDGSPDDGIDGPDDGLAGDGEGPDDAPGALGPDGTPRRRGRRRRGRRRPDGPRGPGGPGAPGGPPRPSATEGLPPPAPVTAPQAPVVPKQDPSYRSDMPF